jgi:ATP-dependent RNA helicase DeaD
MTQDIEIQEASATPKSFEDMGLAEPILQAVRKAGYETPSPIQECSIPPILEGRDLLGVAQTGTGKTAAFSLPLLSRLDESVRGAQILVLAPTRELALQVAEAMEGFAENLSQLRVVAVYGGTGYGEQIKEFKRGAQIVVGTPGRIMDHIEKGYLKLDHLQLWCWMKQTKCSVWALSMTLSGSLNILHPKGRQPYFQQPCPSRFKGLPSSICKIPLKLPSR